MPRALFNIQDSDKTISFLHFLIVTVILLRLLQHMSKFLNNSNGTETFVTHNDNSKLLCKWYFQNHCKGDDISKLHEKFVCTLIFQGSI